MLYQYLTQADFITRIQPSHLNQATHNDASIIRASEAAALSYIKDYLRQRFDVDKIFPPFAPYSSTFNYKASDNDAYRIENNVLLNYTYQADQFYQCTVDATGKDPVAESGYWKAKDPRDPKLVRIVSDVAIFYIMRRVSPDKLSGIIADMYNESKEWLDLVNKGEITPLLPKYDDAEQPSVDTILWGSNPRRTHYY